MHIESYFWAPLATGIGIIISVCLWYLNQHRKLLSFIILQKNPVLNLKGAARKQLDIRFGGHSISDAYLIVLRIFNRGRLPINLNDYQTSIYVGLHPGAEILAASVIETNPPDLEERAGKKNHKTTLIDKIEDERVYLRPVLMNEGDSITLQLLVRNTSGAVHVHGHIQGIRRITNWQENRVWPKFLTYAGAMVMAFAMLGVEPKDIVDCAIEHILPFVLVFLIGLTWLSAGIYWPKSAESISL